MKSMMAINASNQKTLAQHVRVASSLLQRAVGLLGTSTLRPDEGLWLKPCKSIHTFFMRYPIDVLFLDAEGTIIRQDTLVPWRFSRWEPRAEGVLEVAAGTLAKTQTQTGHRIDLKDHS